MKLGQRRMLTIICFHSSIVNQAVVLILATLSRYVLQRRSIDNISDSVDSRIHPLLGPSQSLKLLIVVTAERTNGSWTCENLLLLLISLFAITNNLPVITALAAFAPLVAHFCRLFFLLAHKPDTISLKLHGQGCVC